MLLLNTGRWPLDRPQVVGSLAGFTERMEQGL
jgi:hypothetical protein